MSVIRLCAVAIAASGLLTGCASHHRASPYAPAAETDRDGEKAQRLNAEAAKVMDKDPVKAEKLLREALTADLYHGPAHNNLGVVFLKRGDLYAAASEFEWAKKLLSGHPDPRMNLALTLERAGRTDDALATYATALEVYPDHIPNDRGDGTPAGAVRKD
jgi:tetratricopeptide (TPR) repeat protein